ncbi:MAG: hypothetical protein LQ338_001338 [Usnochroma carphineum]|nr:MAG: hypothetical protein LQ338_001338 [Usnochroma carphineum]
MSPPKDTKLNDGATEPPLEDEVIHNGQIYKRVREGLADILNRPPTQAGEKGQVKQSVFYNPIQQFNRDLSVLAIRVFAQDLAIIRRARHERTLENLAKRAKKGNKRRRCWEGHAEEARDGRNIRTEEGPEASQDKKRKREEESDHEGAEEVRETKKVKTPEESQDKKRKRDDKGHGEEAEDVRETKKVKTPEESQDKKRKRDDKGHGEEAEDVRETKKVKTSEASQEVNEQEPPAATTNAGQQQCIEDTTHGGPDSTKIDGPLTGNTGAAVDIANCQSEEMPDGHHHREARHDDADSDKSWLKNGLSPGPAPPFRILDALSATGLRALRYAAEIPHVTSVTANDLSPSATASIKLNVAYNGLSEKITPTTGDAKAVMRRTENQAKESYHVVDLDPYGTAAPFLDAAVQAVTDGGLLCVTCTDAGIYASVGWPEKAFSQYGGLPWKGPQGHEAGLRLILNAVATSAARYGLAIEPLLSLNIDFYVRLFIRVKRSPKDVKCLASKTMVVYNCDHGCGSFKIQYLAQTREREAKNGDKFHTHSLAQGPTASPLCEHCGFKTHLAGPMWGGPLHNPHFISRILGLLPSVDAKVYGTIPRLEGMLTLALNETLFQEPPVIAFPETAGTELFTPLDPALRDPHPFFFNPSTLSRTLHCSRPSDAEWRGALIGLGYRTTRSHTEPGSIRTDAPWHVIWEIMREWVRQRHPSKEGAIKEGMAGWEILRKDRSRKRLNDAKQELRDSLDKAESVEGLRESVEAALYRIGKETEDTAYSEEPNGTSGQKDVDGLQRELKVVFDEKLGKEAAGKKLLRYQMNPRPEWGPMTKAKGGP